jgi:hypothetical protein
MADILCQCGELIDLDLVPNPNEFYIVADALIERMVDRIVDLLGSADTPEELSQSVWKVFSHHYTPGLMWMVECPRCGRQWVFARSTDSIPAMVYVPEEHNFPNQIDSLKGLTDSLENGWFPPGWQEGQLPPDDDRLPDTDQLQDYVDDNDETVN